MGRLGLGAVQHGLSALLDSHCHLDFPVFDPDRDAVLERARSVGVDRILVPGTHPDTWDRTLALAGPHVCVALGVHPWFPGPLDGLADALSQPGVVAVGECGLDRGHGGPLDDQVALLRPQLELAADLDLPVVLHCVGAHGRLIELLERFGRVRGVLHSASCSPELVARYARVGLCFGFGAAIGWDRAQAPKRALQAAPAGRVLLESDGPDQPHARGQRSEPADVARTLKLAAAVRGCTPDALRAELDETASALFTAR